MHGTFSFSRVRGTTLLIVGLVLAVGPLHAQQRPATIPATLLGKAPNLYSGKLSVVHGRSPFFGTATYVRRFVALTAGHLLYQPATGFSTGVTFTDQNDDQIPAFFFAALSGYQAAANDSVNADAAFDQDMGYLCITTSVDGYPDAFCDWAASPGDLGAAGPFLALGYAAESLDGSHLASVQTASPYTRRLDPGLYENTGYYSEEGMSGGPVYSLAGGQQTLLAITVAGTSYPQRALSAVRAITPAEAALLTSAEYDHKLIRGGAISGPRTMAARSAAKFKTGVIFSDGYNETTVYHSPHYDDLKLVAAGPYKTEVAIVKRKPGKYLVTVGADVPAGTRIPLHLFRAALPQRNQQALQTLTIAVQ